MKINFIEKSNQITNIYSENFLQIFSFIVRTKYFITKRIYFHCNKFLIKFLKKKKKKKIRIVLPIIPCLLIRQFVELRSINFQTLQDEALYVRANCDVTS